MFNINKGVLALLLFYFAESINVPTRLFLGLPTLFTVKQIALVVGIAITLPHLSKNRTDQYNIFAKSIKYLIIFYVIELFSYFALIITSDNYDSSYYLHFLSTGGNIFWLFTAGNVLSQGLTENDKYKLLKGLVLIGLITLVSGFYEGISGSPIMSEGLARKGLGGFFWIRGFQLDKIDFVISLAPAAFSAYILFLKNGFKRNWYLLIYLSVSAYCIFFSYSTTGILGTVGGLLTITLLSGQLRKKLLSISFIIIIVVLILGYISTERGQYFYDRYNLKYTRIVDNIEDRARYQMSRICLVNFIESPIWGKGAGITKENIWQSYVIPYNSPSALKSAHTILIVFADLGLIGGIPFLLFWIYLYVGIFRLARKKASVELSSGTRMLVQLSMGMSIIVFFQLIIYYHHMASVGLIFWPAIVYATSGVKPKPSLST